MATHHLKIHPDLFPAVQRGDKTAEIRRNDRDYQVGDVLALFPFNPDTQQRVGNEECRRVVSHIVQGGQYGIEAGFVLLSMR